MSYFCFMTHPELAVLAQPLSRESYSLYTSFNLEMMIDESKNGLKGQHNLAQGKRSDARGLESGHENRPREKVDQRENLISDERDDLIFSGNDAFQFRPKGIICFVHCILADGFSSASFTQGGVSVRSSLNYALG